MSAPGPMERESRLVTTLKALLYGVAVALYLAPLSSAAGIAAAEVGVVLGMLLAGAAGRIGLRLPVILALAVAGLVGAMLAGGWVLDTEVVPGALGVKQSFMASDVVTFGIGAAAVLLALRVLVRWRRELSLLEVLFVSGSVVVMFMDHRNQMLNRPRFLSDWAWSFGRDPMEILSALGVIMAAASVMLFLRGQRLLKLATTVVMVLLLLGLGYYLIPQETLHIAVPRDALGITGKKKEDKGKKDKGRGGKSDNPFKDNYDSSRQPSPVAIALLRDDFTPRNDVMYFRQVVLSSFNGHHLVRAGEGWDEDVITAFPKEEPVKAARSQSAANHTQVPTTMYLLVDHPQPIGLGHPARYKLVQNPNPQKFVAAYDVKSQVLSVPTQRLLGRASVPDGWSKKQRKHYTALPDDPRYRTLADIIVRQVEPRFAHDDLARAYAIKRYLETEGFYTLRSKHSSRKDPTASFLFGSLRGYCVHFAHAAAYLMRSQGIAARVALGYAVQTTKRGGGSSVLVMSDRAHAWPEIHLDGIGWVTFDIYPERTDMPPPRPVDYDLEKLLGELARKDRTAGLRPDGKPFEIPWQTMGQVTLLVLAGLLLLAYLVKIGRRMLPLIWRGPARTRLAYVALLDRLSDLGAGRRRGETRERHAARLAARAPHLMPLTYAHLGRALGSAHAATPEEFAGLVAQVDADLKKNVHPVKRMLALINPIGWMLTR